jgi:integral membrane protein
MLNWFKKIALLEGISFLVLIFNMLVLKSNYFDTYKLILKPFGMLHGILFILYIILAFLLKDEKNWKLKDFSIIILASFIPFGTFWVDRKYLKLNA